MATKLNKRNTPLKSQGEGDVDPQTPSKVQRVRRSSSRTKNWENEDSANDVTPSPKVSSTRRSTRITEKRSRIKSADQGVVEEVSDIKVSSDEEWEYDVPQKSYFNQNPDVHVPGYSFKTPKKKDGMVALAYNTPKRIIELKGFGTPKTPKTPRTPKGLTTPKTPKVLTTPKTSKALTTPKTPKSSRKVIQPKTPSNLRAKLQKGNSLSNLCSPIYALMKNHFRIEKKMQRRR